MKSLFFNPVDNARSYLSKLSLRNFYAFLIKKGKKSKAPFNVTGVWKLPNSEDGQKCIRVHPSLIKSPQNPKGLFASKDMVTIFNEDNGRFATVFVLGAGSGYTKMQRSVIAVDVPTRHHLGIQLKQTRASLSVQSAGRVATVYSMAYEQGSPMEQFQARTWLSSKMADWVLAGIIGALIATVFTLI